MTTLVLVQTPEDVIFGFDSLTTFGNEQNTMINPKGVVNNGVLFLVGGSTAAIDQVEQLEFPSYDGTDPRKWIARVLSPALRQMIEDNEFLLDSKGRPEIGVLVVVTGQAFELDTVFSPGQNTSGIYTLGTGGDYALGALYVLKAAGITEDDLMLALETAAKIDAYTGGALIVGRASKYIEAEGKR